MGSAPSVSVINQQFEEDVRWWNNAINAKQQEADRLRLLHQAEHAQMIQWLHRGTRGESEMKQRYAQVVDREASMKKAQKQLKTLTDQRDRVYQKRDDMLNNYGLLQSTNALRTLADTLRPIVRRQAIELKRGNQSIHMVEDDLHESQADIQQALEPAISHDDIEHELLVDALHDEKMTAHSNIDLDDLKQQMRVLDGDGIPSGLEEMLREVNNMRQHNTSSSSSSLSSSEQLIAQLVQQRQQVERELSSLSFSESVAVRR